MIEWFDYIQVSSILAMLTCSYCCFVISAMHRNSCTIKVASGWIIMDNFSHKQLTCFSKT